MRILKSYVFKNMQKKVVEQNFRLAEIRDSKNQNSYLPGKFWHWAPF